MSPTLLAALAALTLGALAALLWPVFRRPRPATGEGPDLAVYRDQLAELERDLARGLVRPEEAAAARVEVERRLLRASAAADDHRAGPAASAPRRGGRAVLAVVALLLPLLTSALYLRLGTPTLPDRPLASRGDELEQDATPQIREMVAGLETRLAAAPDDLGGWLMLGRSKGVLGDAPGAVAALRRAQELAPEDPRVLVDLGEALVSASGGMVTPEASGLFERHRGKVGVAAGDDPRPGYYLGLAAAQAGDNRAAVDLWRGLLASAPADADWRPRVEEAVRAAARDLGLDPATVLAQAPGTAAPRPELPRPELPRPEVPRPAGPTAADAEAVRQMSPEDQAAFIRGMVDRLEAKLAADGSDVEGWRRLAQARVVLGEREEAGRVYDQALALHPAEPGLLKAYAALLRGPPRPETGLPEVGERAGQLYERAAVVAPDDPEAQWYLGVRAAQQGRTGEARDRWGRVLARLEPTHPEYAAIKKRLDSLGG